MSRKLPYLLTILTSIVHVVTAVHHMRLSPVILATTDTSTRPIRITNHCPVDIYPAIQTQAGSGPTFGGYHALPGNTTSFEVSAGWQGRIWARTNCTFNENGTSINGTGAEACLTGDCGGLLDCQGTVRRLYYLCCENGTEGDDVGKTSYTRRIHNVGQHESVLLRYFASRWLQSSIGDSITP